MVKLCQALWSQAFVDRISLKENCKERRKKHCVDPWDMSAINCSISLTWNNAILLNHHSLFRENSENPLRSSAESHVSPKKVGCFVRGTPKSSVYRWNFPWNKPIGITIPALKINKSLKPPKFGWFIHGKSQSKMDDEMGYPHFRKPSNVSTTTPTLGLFFQPTGTNCFGGGLNQRKLRLQ